MTVPSFKVNSKPQLSQAEFDANKKEGSGGKFLNEPGSYDMTIKEVTFQDTPNSKDNAWISAAIVLESPEGKTLKHFQMVPLECRNSFLFGSEKSVFPLETLQKFLRGLGIVFDYDNGMAQVGAIFGNPNVLIGKTIKVRLGYKGPHIKFLGKDKVVLVEADHKTLKIEGEFANKDAAIAAAEEAGINKQKIAGFINILEFFPAKEPLIDLEAKEDAAVDLDLPF